LTQPFVRNRINVKSLQPDRNKWLYRETPQNEGPRWHTIYADFINAFAWWWIFTHLWYQPGHVFGEYDFPVPAKWTDAELGVADID